MTHRKSTTQYDRRNVLKKLGGAGVGAIAGSSLLQVASTTGSAESQGGRWTETNSDYGQYEVEGTGAYQCLDMNASLAYGGPHSGEDGTIEHKFAIATVNHAYEGEKNSEQYSSVYVAAPSFQHKGNQFTVENPSGDIEKSMKHSFPGYVTPDTNPDWSTVVNDGTGSLDQYRQEIIHTTPGSDIERSLLATASGLIIGVVREAGGIVVDLADLAFEAGDKPNLSGASDLDDPQGMRWEFKDLVPINMHHVELDFQVPEDGDTHTATIKQEAIVDDEDTMLDHYGVDNGFEWELELPGEESEATLKDEGTYRASH